MPNVFDYLAWRGDLSFEKAPFNEVDSLILCRLSYIPFDGIVPEGFAHAVPLHEAARICLEEARPLRLEADARLLAALAASERFGNASLAGYVNRFDPVEEKQFAALVIQPAGELPYVAFRGTDGTLVGWKEDFNMSFRTVVPAQRDAVAYLDAAAAALPGGLRVGGHSKGGNLAAYSAAFCCEAVQQRIAAVFNHDGPGFMEEVIAREGFQRIRERMHTFAPQSSVVGQLLQHGEELSVVHSTNTWFLQHDLYSWETAYNGLLHAESLTRGSMFIDSTIKAWLVQMAPEDRGRLVDGIYAAFAATGAVTVADLNHPKNAVAALREIKKLDEPTKALLQQALELLGASARVNFSAMLERVRRRAEAEDAEQAERRDGQ